ncbi:hypothetical protein VE00_02605 [Pseudogymnoascus sp. WSF 3629]|nr:hypothetical protein VE00_02605 [Pseudogymnoascus sp. WSF 3629]
MRIAVVAALAATLPIAHAAPQLASSPAIIQGRTPADSQVLHNVQLQYCPLACEYAGPNTVSWTTYHSYDELALCNNTVLFTLNVRGSTLEPRIKACSTTGGGPRMQAGAFYGLRHNNVTKSPSPEIITQMFAPAARKIASKDGSCGATLRKATVEIETKWSSQQGTSSTDELSAALSQLEKYFRNAAGCGSALMFSRSKNSVVGAFAGGDLAKSTVADLIKGSDELTGITLPGQYAVQACDAQGNEPAFDTRFGLFADLNGNAASVQTFLKDYSAAVGKCVDLKDLETGDGPVSKSVTVLGSSITVDGAVLKNTTSNSTTFKQSRSVQARALCRDTKVYPANTCASLAQTCGISGSDFAKYNSQKANLCSTLMPGQYVCCSAGDLADHTPQPLPGGDCFPYTIQKNDICWESPTPLTLTSRALRKHICLSSGNPPMPAQDPTTLCGPWVVGTTRPANYDDVAKLNSCPLNACCDIWGQCGTTDEFCTKSEVDGHPGTARPLTNGCISNCGTDIFDFKLFTHIHFAFATISTDFKVTIAADVKDQFDKMVAIDSKGSKKILSFGDWSFSTDYDTAPIFSKSVSPANREIFATNVVKFLNDNKLDGLDFDWEYPGATDIPNSVPGSPDDGANYLAFLKSVKSKLATDKTLSIALPSSYWYLRGLPVQEIAKVVNYFVFMTYDLHGQWDYGSKWSNPGCPTGNCLRSHVNLTETLNALSMLTKAGARGNQIMLGVASYGRSFKMKNPACTGLDCWFTGSPSVSDADPGICTGEPGYISNAELKCRNARWRGSTHRAP